MDQSERLQRYQKSWETKSDADSEDEKCSSRILLLLNDPKIDEFCMVDAYYYDFSTLPEHLKDKFYRDMYLIYGINRDGDLVSKWIERYDLDSSLPIENGQVIRGDKR